MTILRVSQSFIILFIAIIAVPAFIHYTIMPLRFAHDWSNYTGWLLILSGFGFFLWANLQLVVHSNGGTVSWDPPKKLIILGPFRYVRNPIAVSIITILLGTSLIFGSFSVLIWSGIYWVLQHTFLLLVEEKALEKRFGNMYRRYSNEVPRWLPLSRPVEFDP